MQKIKGKIYKSINSKYSKENIVCICTENSESREFSGVVLKSSSENVSIGTYSEKFLNQYYEEYIGQLDLNNVFHECKK
jgi:hypothetical protein